MKDDKNDKDEKPQPNLLDRLDDNLQRSLLDILETIGDPTQNYHGGDPESIAAYESIKDKSRLRGIVRSYIAAQGTRGTTSDEAERALGLTHQTCAPRMTELKATNEIVFSGEKRKTKQGRLAKAYMINNGEEDDIPF